MPMMRLGETIAAIEAGTLTIEAAIARSDAAIDERDGEIAAFARRAPAATRQAALLAAGPLRGVPIGVKDMFDTADMATEYGSPIFAGFRPRADAALVAMARAKGAFVAGKTATTEFAHRHPTATRNPHALGHTPGGSSSGSAAAVAAGMVAGAFGSQTAGSVIRPASFCGVAGYKPSFRLLPTVGLKTFAWSLDTAGLFAASVADAGLLAALLTGRDLAVPAHDGSGLTIGVYRSAVDGRLDPDMAAAVEHAARRLEAAGARLVEVAEPPVLTEARVAQPVVQDFEGALALGHERTAERARLSHGLRDALDAGAFIAPEVYDDARRKARRGRKAATALFETVDVILSPSALGAAPETLLFTGDPIMNALWTLTGNPVVNVPGHVSATGLPLGVSVVARFGRDALALSVGALLESLLG